MNEKPSSLAKKTEFPDRLYIQHGYYLQKTEEKGNIYSYNIERILEDETCGKVILTSNGSIGRWIMTFHFEISQLATPIDRARDFDVFKGWCEAAFSILYDRSVSSGVITEMYTGRKYSHKPVKLHALNNDGSESKMNTAITYFDDEQRAIEHHRHMVKANPNRIIRHALYADVVGKQQRYLLVGGKITKFPSNNT